MAKLKGEKRDDFKVETGFFRPGLRDYFMNYGAGHFRLDVGDDVTMAFYPGASLVPARTFALT